MLEALDQANEMVSTITKSEMAEVRSFRRPPSLIGAVLESVLLIKGYELSGDQNQDWFWAKKELGSLNFIRDLLAFDKNNISTEALARVEPYVYTPDLDPMNVSKVSIVAASLCLWVRAMYCYGRQCGSLAELARMRELKREEEQAPKRAPGERLVYINGGTELVSVETNTGNKDFGRQR